jgi:anti-sigma-K factor RskA
MTDQNDSPGEQNPADLAGAYALHALDAQDTAAYEAHLAKSERARIENAELNDTAAALGLAVAPVQPSAALKTNLMSMLASTPQLPPAALRAADPATADASAIVPGAAPVADPTPTLDAPGLGAPGLGAPELGAPELGAEGASPAVGLRAAEPAGAGADADADAARPAGRIRSAADSARRGATPAHERAQARWFKRPASFLLAAAAAVALFVGGTLLGQTLNDNQFVSQQASGLAQINAADDSQRAATTTADGQEATLVWSNKLGISAVLVDNLPALPNDQDYQLWYINAEGAIPAGTFDSSGDGTVWRVLDGTMHAGDAVGVTVEPAGGSDQPTTDPIVAFQS